jgi:hypothetical protein
MDRPICDITYRACSCGLVLIRTVFNLWTLPPGFSHVVVVVWINAPFSSCVVVVVEVVDLVLGASIL